MSFSLVIVSLPIADRLRNLFRPMASVCLRRGSASNVWQDAHREDDGVAGCSRRYVMVASDTAGGGS